MSMRYNAALLSFVLLTGFTQAEDPITVYLAGDSTMAEKAANKRPETGWGEALQQHFRPESVRIANRAMNGRSSRSFIAEGRWQAIVDSLKPGDYVFVQFGHNDAAKDRVDRYTPPDDYRKNLLRFVAEVRQKEAHPVLFTPVARRKFNKDGFLEDTHGEYPDIVRSLAEELKVPIIDLTQKTSDLLRRFGADSSRTLFLQLKPRENANYPQGIEDNTHFSPLGAKLTAELAVEGMREINLELARQLIVRPLPMPYTGPKTACFGGT
jgi:lysophospholipase L1-like esterase